MSAVLCRALRVSKFISVGAVRFSSGCEQRLRGSLLSGDVDRFGGVTVRDFPPQINEDEFKDLLRGKCVTSRVCYISYCSSELSRYEYSTGVHTANTGKAQCANKYHDCVK